MFTQFHVTLHCDLASKHPVALNHIATDKIPSNISVIYNIVYFIKSWRVRHNFACSYQKRTFFYPKKPGVS